MNKNNLGIHLYTGGVYYVLYTIDFKSFGFV